MRTTLVLDDEVYEQARRAAFEERRSIGDVVSSWARRGRELEQRAAPVRALGKFNGQIVIADDFDATPTEVLDALDGDIG